MVGDNCAAIRHVHSTVSRIMPKARTPTAAAPMTPPGQPPLSERLCHPLLIPALFFCVALAIRLWGLSFGLPYFFSVDEINKRDAALRLAETGFIHRTSQPSFLYNSLYLVFSLAGLFSPDWTTAQYHYMGRVWMAVLGALTVVALYYLGLLWDRRIGLLAALLLAILPWHTATSRYIKEDTPLTLMATVTILLVVRYLKHPSRTGLAAAALFAGIAFSTKYSGLLLALPLLLAFAVSAWRARQELRAIALDAGTIVLAFWLGFFLVSPIYLVHFDQFVSGFLGQWEYSSSGHHDGIINAPWDDWWTYYLRTGVIPGMTWPVFVLSVAGLILMLRSREGWVVTVTAVWLYLVFEHGRAKPYPFSVRYLLPMAPLLCLAAAMAAMRFTDLLKRTLPPRAAYALCAALFVLPPLAKSLLIADEALHDTRMVAGAWMEQAVPPGAKIVVTAQPAYLPVSERWGRGWGVFPPEKIPELLSSSAAEPPFYVVISSFTYQRYLDHPDAVPQWTRFYRRLMEQYRLVKEFRPRWLTYGLHSPVIQIYQPPTQTDRVSVETRHTTGPPSPLPSPSRARGSIQ